MEKVFALLKKATISEIIALCVFLFGIASGIVSIIMFVEDRYAKELQIKEHQALIQEQKAQIEGQKEKLREQEDQLINMINSMPEDIRKQIGERILFAQQYRKANPLYIPPN
nr:MAG: hypothetical protein [Caudoviricetes sp.]